MTRSRSSTRKYPIPDNDAADSKGCIICKSRKVKCDRHLGSCLNCKRLGISCPGYETRNQDHRVVLENAFRIAGREKRALGSCLKCRSLKIRCSRQRPKCDRCQERCLECVYASKRGREGSCEDRVINTPELIISVPDEGIPDKSFPGDKELKEMAEIYFARVHPLRCLGFIHKATFMQCLDQGSLFDEYGEALLLTICAFGARYQYMDNKRNDDIPGLAWIENASAMVFRQLGFPSLRTLMTLILLCEYNMRWGRSSTAIMMATCCSQMARLLRLDRKIGEQGETSLSLEKEIQTRVYWSCFLLDCMIGSGVESLATMKTSPCARLPCSQQAFALGVFCSTQTLISDEACVFPSHPPVAGIEASFLRLMYLRGYILELIRKPHLDIEPWTADSDFRRPIRGLHQWKQMLPQHLEYTQLNTYIHRDQQQLAPFYALHLLYHQAFCDLYRVALPGYRFPIKDALSNAPRSFLLECQNESLRHAQSISRLLESAASHGRFALDDPICGICAYESTKIQVIIGRSCSPGLAVEGWGNILSNVQMNLQVVDQLCTYLGWGTRYMTSLCKLLDQFNLFSITAQWEVKYGLSNESDARPTAENHHLHPLAIYQIAWKECDDDSARNTPIDATEGDNSNSFIAPEYYTQVATDLQDYISWQPFTFADEEFFLST